MRKVLLAFVYLGLIGVQAQAKANTNAGCGLGSYVIDKRGLIWNLFQITTNGTSFNQTFGISSGTLGCRQEGIALDSRVQEFVAANMDSLSKEIAQGRGETLDTFLELLNIENKDEFRLALQENYHRLYPHKDSQSFDVMNVSKSL